MPLILARHIPDVENVIMHWLGLRFSGTMCQCIMLYAVSDSYMYFLSGASAHKTPMLIVTNYINKTTM